MVAALRAQNGDHPSLEVLSKPGAVTVVTGQQVGLFTGPAYTIYKALTAAKLAQQLSSRGTPAVPVFWLATEDHDFAEVNHAWSFDHANRPVRFEVNGHAGNNRPVGSIVIDKWPVEEFRASVADFPFGTEVADLVEETYRPGVSLGDACRRLLERLLQPYGFLFLDPLHPTTRQLAAPILSRAVKIGSDLNELLLKRSRELDAAGITRKFTWNTGRPCSSCSKKANVCRFESFGILLTNWRSVLSSCRQTRCFVPWFRIICFQRLRISEGRRNLRISRSRRCCMSVCLGTCHGWYRAVDSLSSTPVQRS